MTNVTLTINSMLSNGHTDIQKLAALMILKIINRGYNPRWLYDSPVNYSNGLFEISGVRFTLLNSDLEPYTLNLVKKYFGE